MPVNSPEISQIPEEIIGRSETNFDDNQINDKKSSKPKTTSSSIGQISIESPVGEIIHNVTSYLNNPKINLDCDHLQFYGKLVNSPSSFVRDSIKNSIDTLEKKKITNEFKNEFEKLITSKSTENISKVNNIINFFEEYFYVYFGKFGNDIDLYDNFFDNKESYLISFLNYLNDISEKSDNFLVKKKINELLNLEGLLPDVLEDSHSNPDEYEKTLRHCSIQKYINDHMEESYYNKLLYSCEYDLDLDNPILQVAPGYLGAYEKNKLEYIIKEKPHEKTKLHDFVTSLTEMNDQKLNYIYEDINYEKGYSSNDSIVFIKSKIINIINNNPDFIFDLSKIDTDNIILEEIIDFNYRIIKEKNKTKINFEKIKDETLNKLLNPINNKVDDHNIDNYKELISLDTRDTIRNDFEIEISDYDFWVQGNFLSFLERQTVDEVEKLQDFTKKFGGVGLKSFLSLEQDQEMGNKIISIGEKLDEESAKAVFTKYAEITDSVEKISDYLRDNFGEEKNYNEKITQEIANNLLTKGKDLLVRFAEKPMSKEEILMELDNIKIELLLFAGTFKTLKNEGCNVELDDFKKIKINSTNGNEISPNEQAEMIKIADNNWKNYPKLHDIVMGGFKDALESSDKKFYILKYDKDVIGFIRFDPMGEFELYAGSLNIRPDLRGSAIGEAVLKNILGKEAQSHVLNATAYPKLPICPRYIGEFGFTVNEIISDYEGTGEPFFKIIRDDTKNKEYSFFNKNTELIKKAYQDNKYDLNQNQIILKFDFSTDYQNFIKNAKSILDSGNYIMSSYKRDKENPNIYYSVFEKKQEKLQELKTAA
jgi:hypothetical protein